MSNNKEEKLLNVQEVAVLIHSSVPTISAWYRWKKENPDNEYAKMLPAFIRKGAHRERRWKYSDVWKLVEFKQSIPQGRNGVMGSVTQRYCKKKNKQAENSEEKEDTLI